ncbi:MAG TPA: BamA/TamA family outer membrane protein [Gemmatimonadales bacterium]|nr:BamA/TamA family outer membrane protein [Gemmatimonadales bacterium]
MALLAAVTLAAPLAPLAAQNDQRVVRGLSFEGNKSIDSYTLRSAIATTPSAWLARVWWVRWLGLGEKRYLDEIEFRRDVVRLLLLYRQSGYMRARIDTLVDRTDDAAWITFRITEGPPVRVTRMTITGVDGILDTTVLRGGLPLKVGAPFNRFLFQASADSIVSRLQNLGHPAAEVLRNFDSNADSLTATVELDAQPGSFARVGTIRVQGLKRVDTSTVMHAIPLRSADMYRQDQIYESQRNLYSLGLFGSVTVAPADSVAPDDSVVNVAVQVTEGPRHAVRGGIGYGSVDCFRAQAGWSAVDFLGGGRSLDLTGSVSKLGVGYPTNWGLEKNVCGYLLNDSTADTLNYTLSATLSQPSFLSPRHTGSLTLLGERRSEYRIYTRQDVGANVGVVFNAHRDVPVSVGYGISVGRTIASNGLLCALFQACDAQDQSQLVNTKRFAAVSATAVRDQVNSVLDPTEGSRFTLNFTHSSRFVGADPFYDFNRGELEYSQYFPLGRSGVFAWRVRGGMILGGTSPLAGQSTKFVPLEQRFYAGGPNSVRGYGRNELGPTGYFITDTTASKGYRLQGQDTIWNTLHTAPLGGNAVVVMNAELRFATPILPDRMRVALFVDVGQVWERGDVLTPISGLRVTPGAGLRFTTPLGPVRLDAAYRGHRTETGVLYYVDPKSHLLSIRDAAYQPPTPSSFWRRVFFQFAVGQAF